LVSENVDGYRVKCDSCGARYWYSLEKLDEYGAVECQNCGAKVFVDSMYGGARAVYPDNDAILPSKETTQVSVEGIKIKCPNCLARYIYKDHQMLENGKVECQNCGLIIDAVGEDVIIYGGATESDSNTVNGVLICLFLFIFLFVPLIIALPVIACILIFWGLSNKNDDGERKAVRRDAHGPSVR
jgi:predicted Zn finger-like uncharacterized protein